MNSILYLVSTPIGDKDDITLRALTTLRTVDYIVCEELKMGRRITASYGIRKELIELNEHNEEESSRYVVELLKRGNSIALISDAGTPLFSDPGHYLLNLCIAGNIDVKVVPGASSIMTALVGSGLDFEKFYYYGWLSPKKEMRRKELQSLKKIGETIVILDTPYRLRTLLADVQMIFGGGQGIVLAYELTTKKEKFFRGHVKDILTSVQKNMLKGEFVLLIDNKSR